jgi:hypothetical protein
MEVIYFHNSVIVSTSGKEPLMHIYKRLGPRAGLDVVVKRKVSVPVKI